MNANWHPECFTCELCNKQLADVGFLRNAGRFIFDNMINLPIKQTKIPIEKVI
jgi:hypothetical protein